MNRRIFLKKALASSIAAGLPFTGLQQASAASLFPEIPKKIVVFLHLPGGPDMRFLTPPPYNSTLNSVGYQFWQARAGTHELDVEDPQSWAGRWNTGYTQFTEGSNSFGILNRADWLQSMWNAGNVSIVNNVVGGTSRNHNHCQLILDQGNIDSGPNDLGRSGWGGRLAQAVGGNVVAVTKTPRRFCFGADPSDPEKSSPATVVSAVNSRDMALYEPTPPTLDQSRKSQLSRSLKGYYASKRNEINNGSIYRQFIDQELQLRNLGAAIDSRLSTEPIPAAIEALYYGEGTLNSAYFGKQVRNLRDCLLVSDILNMKVVSMEYPGWDTHTSLKGRIEPMFDDLFSSNGGLATLYDSLPENVADKLVFVIAGEFGRQLKTNGSNGLDHGQGNSMIIIGNSVNGLNTTATSTVYGDMFPSGELDRLGDRSPDIAGLTELDHILGAVCDGVQPGAGNSVFPLRASRRLEDGVDFSSLYG